MPRAFISLLLMVIGGACTQESSTAPAASPETSLGRIETLLAPATDQFASATTPRPFSFPADHGPHPEFRYEWWYFTGHLLAATGQRFGFELTLFRFALAPGPGPVNAQSHWRTTQAYAGHFAITDVARREFHSAERAQRAAIGLAGASVQPLHVWVEDWSLQARDGRWILHAADGGRELDLELTESLPPVLNGDAGVSRKGNAPGAATYYYSVPRLAARGRLADGHDVFTVEGSAWLDREWGSGSLSGEQSGWDWFALQLDDGSTLMFYALRTRTGGRDPHSAGTWVDTRGVAHALRNDAMAIEVLDHWQSPRGGTYPSRWRLHVASLALDLELVPVLADQELETTPRYWEGAVDVAGTHSGAPLAGRGYVELTGYAR